MADKQCIGMQCPHCGGQFSPGCVLQTSSQVGVVICPLCGSNITPQFNYEIGLLNQLVREVPLPHEEVQKEDIPERRDVCWLCGGQLIWQSDANYNEVKGEGEGIVAFLTCRDCGAEVEYSRKD